MAEVDAGVGDKIGFRSRAYPMSPLYLAIVPGKLTPLAAVGASAVLKEGRSGFQGEWVERKRIPGEA